MCVCCGVKETSLSMSNYHDAGKSLFDLSSTRTIASFCCKKDQHMDSRGRTEIPRQKTQFRMENFSFFKEDDNKRTQMAFREMLFIPLSKCVYEREKGRE